ncbi:MAG: carboxypeptidase regulatory-like domain-containing protein [Planctomycetota bacterium]
MFRRWCGLGLAADPPRAAPAWATPAAALPVAVVAATAAAVALWLGGDRGRYAVSDPARSTARGERTAAVDEVPHPSLDAVRRAASVAFAGGERGPGAAIPAVPPRPDEPVEHAVAGRPIRGRVVLPPAAPADPTLRVRALLPSPEASALPPWLRGIWDHHGYAAWLLAERWREVASASVEAGGGFRVVVPAELCEVWLTVDGRFAYLPEPTRLDPRTPEPALLRAEAGAWVRGTIAVSAGDPGSAAGGLVVLAPKPERLDTRCTRALPRLLRTARVGDDGVFEVRGVAPGAAGTRWFCGVNATGLLPASLHGLALTAGRTHDLRVALERGARASGRVVDGEGAAVAGARVVCEDPALRRTWASVPVLSDREVRTGADGRFELRGLQPASAVLSARCAGFLWSDWHPLSNEPEREGIELVLLRGEELGGRVRWPDGSPAAGAEVTIGIERRETEEAVRGRAATCRTDARGAFRATGLARGEFAVHARAQRDGEARAAWIAERREAPSGGAAVELVLARGATLAVRVEDEEGAALKSYELELSRPREGWPAGLPLPEPRRRWVEEPGGHAVWEGLLAGPWDVAVRAEGKAARHRRVHVGAAGASELFTLQPASVLRGRVVTPAGEPVVDAEVGTGDAAAFARADAVYRLFGFLRTRTDAHGEFELTAVAPGDVLLSARKRGLACPAPTRLELRPGEERSDLLLVLEPAGAIEGLLRGPSGSVLAGRHFRALGPDGKVSLPGAATTEGTFRVSDLPAGVWTLTAGPGEGTPADIAVKVRPGETTQVLWGGPGRDTSSSF